MNRTRVLDGLLAAARGLALALMTYLAGIVLFVLCAVSIVLVPIGLGVFLLPPLISLQRRYADARRRLTAAWGGPRVSAPYRVPPEPGHGGVLGLVQLTGHYLKDPATWRDLQWLLVDATAGLLLAVLPPGLLAEGVFGSVLAAGVWRPIGTYWYAFIRVDSQFTAFLAAGLGLVWIFLALAFGPLLVRAHCLLSGALLAPTRQMTLSARVERLQETRHDAVDSSAAELRRIERDLHDGAQARLVAMGMSLGTIEALIEKDPARARELLAQARQNSAEALTELRDLVRGIHPPVLAERGLGDAVQALALRSQIPVEVDVELPGRFEEAVESAAYFATSEIVTNAVKHSGADRIWVDIRHSRPDGGMLQIAVTDNGRGGADLRAGTGMLGVQRRLGAFDGVLAVSSPAGGPTLVTLEIPAEPVTRAAGR